MSKTWSTCEICYTRTKNIRRFKRTFMCYQCYVKRVHLIGQSTGPRKTIEQALAKTYKVNGYLNKNGTIRAIQINVPQILIGHKVKLVLADGGNI